MNLVISSSPLDYLPMPSQSWAGCLGNNSQSNKQTKIPVVIKLAICYVCRDEVPSDELKPLPVSARYLACKTCYETYMTNRSDEPY